MALNGYDYFTDYETGDFLAIDRNTGEVSAAECIPVPKGTIFYTPQQQEEYKRARAEEEKRALRKASDPFYFARCADSLSLSPETTTRLLYIMSFAGHKENGRRLLINNRTPMQKKDLPDVLEVSKPTALKFFSDTSPKFIQEDEKGLTWTESGWFYRGTGLRLSDDLDYTRVFCDCMKKLYKGARGKNIKYLGYIFQMLPYVNREYNFLCRNPKEKDIRKVDKMNLLDVCGLLGIDTHNIDRLYKMLSAQTFEIDGCKEWFFRLFNQPNSRDYKTADICINPNLIYAGSNFKQVEYMVAAPERKKKMIGAI